MRKRPSEHGGVVTVTLSERPPHAVADAIVDNAHTLRVEGRLLAVGPGRANLLRLLRPLAHRVLRLCVDDPNVLPALLLPAANPRLRSVAIGDDGPVCAAADADAVLHTLTTALPHLEELRLGAATALLLRAADPPLAARFPPSLCSLSLRVTGRWADRLLPAHASLHRLHLHVHGAHLCRSRFFYPPACPFSHAINIRIHKAHAKSPSSGTSSSPPPG